MKITKIAKLLVIVVLVTVSLVSSAPVVRAQNGTGDDKLDAILASISQVATKLNDKGYTVVNITIDKGFQGETYETSRTLYAGNEYIILGAGADGVSKLGINLLDAQKNIIDKAPGTDASPLLTTRPDKDAKHFFETTIVGLDGTADNNKSYFFGYVIGFKNLKSQ